jgi:hypothetical protein
VFLYFGRVPPKSYSECRDPDDAHDGSDLK